MRQLSPLLALLAFCCYTKADPCPPYYTQAPNGGDCFRTVLGLPWPSTVNNAETQCGFGGLLASIHSEEENEFARTMLCQPGYPEPFKEKIIGLKCTHIGCAWDDGTPVDYKRFGNPTFPGTGCFVIQDQYGTWFPPSANCGSQRGCWLCRVKAKRFDCAEGEIAYKGGCISIHSEPVDQKTAEHSCPNGGHLVSIHSGEEDVFYRNLALDAGWTLPYYIGGTLLGNDMTWIDQTFNNYQYFAKFFPNPPLGNCVQVMLSNEFGNIGQWTNIDCTTRLPYICFYGGKQLLSTTTMRPTPTTKFQPLANATCPPLQDFNGYGKIYSPNYPISIPSEQKCEYLLVTDSGTKANIKFPSYDCQSGTRLSLYNGLDSTDAFMIFTSTPPSPKRVYSATSNVIKMVFEASSPVSGIGWEAEFFSLKS